MPNAKNTTPEQTTFHPDGRGKVRSGLLTNESIIHFVDGDTEVFGELDNNGNLNVTACTATFFDLVKNSGTGVSENTEP